MALFLNGKKLLNSLVIDGDTSGGELPYVVYCSCINCSQRRTITFTATEDGIYQLYLFWTTSIIPSTTDLDVKLNGVDVTLTYAITTRGYAYAEIELSVGDVLTISNTYTDSNRGIIATITQNAKISNYALIGEASNDGTTFQIGSGKFVLEWYQYSFYSGASRYNYMIVADAPTSIATPSGSSSYYYGGTSAIQL